MRYLILIKSKTESLRSVAARLSFGWQVCCSEESISAAMKDDESKYVSIQTSSLIENDYEDEERLAILRVIPDPVFCYVKYSDRSTLRLAFRDVVGEEECLVDNNRDGLMTGSDFLARWEGDAGWDWEAESSQ